VPACEANQNVVASLHDALSIQYELYRPDIHPGLKAAQALDTVDTEYAVFCADDDFIIPNAIEKCVRFLDSNPDYASVQGHIINARVNQDVDGNSHNQLHLSLKRQVSIEFDDPILRLKKYFMTYGYVWYAIHRRSQLARILCRASDFRGNKIQEVLVNTLSVIQGKRKVLDALYMVKQALPVAGKGRLSQEPPAAGAKSRDKEYIPWPETLSSDYFSEEYALFRNYLAEEVINYSDISKTEAESVVNRLFWEVHIRRRLEGYWRKRAVVPLQSGLNRAFRRVRRTLSILPIATRVALLDRQLINLARIIRRSPWEAYDHLRREKGIDFALETLLDRRSRFHDDFVPIYELLSRYPFGIASSSSLKKSVK